MAADVTAIAGSPVAKLPGYVGSDRRASTRTAAITAAIRKELSERTELIDRAEDLAEVTITVKLQAGTSWVRGVVWQEERVCRQRK